MAIILETPRLILRKPKKSDLNDLVEAVNNKYTASRIGIPFPYTSKDGLNFIRYTQKNMRSNPIAKYHFFIELKSEKKVIGDIDLSIKKGIGYTGSWISKKYRRNNYITEAKIAINDFAFDKLKLRKMETSVIITNKPSINVQEKMGYIREGLFRKHHMSLVTKKAIDCVMYGMLKSDWKKRKLFLIEELKGKYDLNF